MPIRNTRRSAMLQMAIAGLGCLLTMQLTGWNPQVNGLIWPLFLGLWFLLFLYHNLIAIVETIGRHKAQSGEHLTAGGSHD